MENVRQAKKRWKLKSNETSPITCSMTLMAITPNYCEKRKFGEKIADFIIYALIHHTVASDSVSGDFDRFFTKPRALQPLSEQKKNINEFRCLNIEHSFEKSKWHYSNWQINQLSISSETESAWLKCVARKFVYICVFDFLLDAPHWRKVAFVANHFQWCTPRPHL